MHCGTFQFLLVFIIAQKVDVIDILSKKEYDRSNGKWAFCAFLYDKIDKEDAYDRYSHTPFVRSRRRTSDI